MSSQSRNRSGVRLAGDDFQHLVTLREALFALRHGGVETLTVEADDAGNVDDIVLRYQNGGARYIQVKHAVDAQTPVGDEWLARPTRRGQRSLLQRLHDSWQQLRSEQPNAAMVLATDRDVDPRDPVMSKLDRSTHRVLPDARSTVAGTRQLNDWQTHLGCTEAELDEMLLGLRFETGLSAHHLRQLIEAELAAAGYRCDQSSIDSAMAIAREWVQSRSRTLAPGEIGDLFDERLDRAREAHSLMVVEAIDDHPAADAADVAVRLVELYPASLDPFERRQLTDPSAWQDIAWPALTEAAEKLRSEGHLNVMVAGAMRLGMWFGAGAAMRRALGFSVSTAQNGQVWSSADGASSQRVESVLEPGAPYGHVLAVAVAVSADLLPEVRSEVRDDSSVRGVLALAPAGGPSNSAVQGGRMAASLAEAIRNAVRRELASGGVSEIRLYMAAPAGLALLLGHLWNSMRPTLVFEHLGTGLGYAPTFLIPA